MNPDEWVVMGGGSVRSVNVYANEDDARTYRRFFVLSWTNGVVFDRLAAETRPEMLRVVDAAWRLHRRWRTYDTSGPIYTHAWNGGRLVPYAERIRWY